MKKIILACLVTLAVVMPVSAQQYRTSYFMEGSTLRNNLNPAFRPYRGYIEIPIVGQLGLGFTSNAFTIDNLFYPNGMGGMYSILSDKVSYDQISGILQPVNNFDFDVRTSILGAGFYTGRGFWDIGLDLRVEGGVSIPAEMFRFLKVGSDVYNMKDVAFGTDIYSVVSAGYSHRITRNLTVGARVNLIGGLGRIKVHYDQLDLKIMGDECYVDAVGVMDVAMTGADVPITSDGYLDWENMSFKPRGLAGGGFSFDVGATYKLLNVVNLSASILDFGMVRWYKNASVQGIAEDSYSFTGFEIDGRNIEMSYTGDLNEFMKFRAGDPKEISSKIKTKVVLGAELPLLNDHLTVGVIYMYKQNEYVKRSEFSAALTLRPTSWLTAALSYSFDGKSKIGDSNWNSLGLALNFHPAWINFFVGTDYMVSRVSTQRIPLGQKVLNYYMGISIPLAKGKPYDKTK